MVKKLHNLRDYARVYQGNTGCIEWMHEASTKIFIARKHIDIRQHCVTLAARKENTTLVPIRSRQIETAFVRKALDPGDLHYKISTIYLIKRAKLV